MNAEHGPVFTRRNHPAPVAANKRASMLEDPGFGRIFTDHMATIRWTAGARLVRRGAPAPRAVRPRSGQRRAPLRPGDLRGPQGLPSQGRRRRPVPPRAERAPLPGLRRAPRDARAAGGCVPARHRGAGEGRRRMGPGRRRQPLSAPVHVRQRDVPRRAPGVGILVRGDRLAGRRLFQGRQEGGQRLALGRVHPRRARGHRRRQMRRQLRREPRRPGRGDPARLRPGRLSRRRRTALGRGARRHERLLRLRRRLDADPAARRHHPAGRHPQFDPHSRPGRGPHGARGALFLRFMAGGRGERTPARGLRLRHGRRRHPDRRDQGRRRRLRHRRRRRRRSRRSVAGEAGRHPARRDRRRSTGGCGGWPEGGRGRPGSSHPNT